jgi:molybdopterin converting factor small subunit
MDGKLLDQIMGLKDGTLEELRAKYAEIFPEEAPSSNNKVFLMNVNYNYLPATIRITDQRQLELPI